MIDRLKTQIQNLKNHFQDQEYIYRKAQGLYIGGHCQVLTRSDQGFEVLINDMDENDQEVYIDNSKDNGFGYFLNNSRSEWDSYGIAALLQLVEEIQQPLPQNTIEGKAYTREGMIRRVLEERRQKARRAKYKIQWADNIYGEHLLINEKGAHYKITLRDFENETGYINNPDLRANKLGTTKHLMYAFDKLKSDNKLYNKLSKVYPFVEVYLDPLNDYRITWHYPHELQTNISRLLEKYFGTKNYMEEDQVMDFMRFLKEAEDYPQITIRPEVEEKVRKAWDNEMLRLVREENELDYTPVNATLYPYQKEGVKFATFRRGAILADEMGLGKTLQAIITAIMKKNLFGFKHTLIICPASLKEQWKKEVEKFTEETVVVIEGRPEERQEIYRTSSAFFMILNYETVLRDYVEINRMDPDFVILDEAQRIKNYETKTAYTIKNLRKKHGLVITGTPIENRLTDLYSIMQFVDRELLEPLWEFSYQHCYFDSEKRDKITGYYNLQALSKKMEAVLLRREKKDVIKDLPKVTEQIIPVAMHPDQAAYHMSYARGVAAITQKKYISPYDLQRLLMLLNKMRMVCDSTFLIDKETNISPKMEELKEILLEKMDVKNHDSKVIIFSEWVTMLQLIGKMLHENGIGFAQLTGKVAVKNREKLIRKFENDPHCKVFLSSQAGGSGLNLQVADTVINFEVPWNPATRNQRIGRIDRLGQLHKHLTVIDFITVESIEVRIASGLGLKQDLFDGVLSPESTTDFVDFSKAGRSQFLKDLEAMIGDFISEDELVESEEELMEPEEEVMEPEEEVIEREEEKELLAEEELEITGAESIPEEELEMPDVSTPEPIPDSKPEPSQKQSKPQKVEEMEQVMNQGLDFLSGLFKMATGKDSGLEGKKMEYDEKTGEVVMRFKLPDLSK